MFITRYLTLVSAVAIAIYITVFGTVKQSGYFCDDKSIRLPYFEAPFNVLSILSASILLSSLYILFMVRSKKKNWSDMHLYYMWLGLSFLYIFIALAKLMTGILRPNFLDVCKPMVDCANNLYIKRQYRYINYYNCTSKFDLGFIEYSRLSFPSAHAGIMFYLITYIFMYTENNSFGNIDLLKRSIQLLSVTVVLHLNVLRVTYNFSRGFDVIIGAVLGIGFAIVFHFVSTKHVGNPRLETIKAPLLDTKFVEHRRVS